MAVRHLLLAVVAAFAIAACACDDDAPSEPAAVASVPILTTAVVSEVTWTTATCGGAVTADGGAPVTQRGVCWGLAALPTTADSLTSDGAGTGDYVSHLAALTAGTTYFVRAYAINSAGTGYGDELSFATPPADPSTVSDIDGNVYRTIRIGSQLWLADNLRVTRFNNGDPLPNVTDNAAWMALTGPAYCWYLNDDATYGTVYGALYNWFAVDGASNGNRSVCPVGWHVPTADDWTTLTTTLGGLGAAGGRLKEAGTVHWLAPNTGATNESGFTALPGGYRGYATGAFNLVRQFGHWWSGTAADPSLAWGEGLFYLDSSADHSTSVKRNGFSIRCVRD